MELLKKKFLAVKEEVVAAQNLTKEKNICLVAVSKGHDFRKIKTLYEFGHLDFGENYVAELIEKQEKLKQSCPKIRWHFLGAIQSNKIKKIARADVIHSLSSKKHAKLLDKACQKDFLHCFLQINWETGKNNRQGIVKEQAKDFLLYCKNLTKIKIIGLMTIPPIHTHDTDKPFFDKMRGLKNDLEKTANLSSLALSMGMSNDFSVAIRAGATYVRVGTAIFGPREYAIKKPG